MCPGCPTFNIPVPIPKSTIGEEATDEYGNPVEYTATSGAAAASAPGSKSVFQRINDGFKKMKDKAMSFFDPVLGVFTGERNTISEKQDPYGFQPIYDDGGTGISKGTG